MPTRMNTTLAPLRSIQRAHYEPGNPNDHTTVTKSSTTTRTSTRTWHRRAGAHNTRPPAAARAPSHRARRRLDVRPRAGQAHSDPARLPDLLRGGRRAVRLREGGPRGGSALHAARFPRFPLRMGRPGVARYRRARRRVPGQRRLRPVGRPRLRPARRLAPRHVEVPQHRHQHRRLPGPRRRLPWRRGPRHRRPRKGAHGHGGRHDGVPVLPELRRPEHCRVGCGGAGGSVAGPVRADDGDGSAEGAAAAVGAAGGGAEGLEDVLQHAVLEPQLLGQREHDGRRGGAAGADVPAGAGGGGSSHRRQLPAAADGGDRRHGRAAGCVGERLLGRRRRHHRRPMAQVLDGGRRGALLHRHVRGPAEQRRVPAPRHGGPGPPPGRLLPPRRPHPDPVGRHRRVDRRHPRRLLPRLRRCRRHRQLPVQPRHAARVRRLPLAPSQAPGAQAPLPRAPAAPRSRGHVRRAVGVPGLRVRGGRVEGVRRLRGTDGARRRVARRHEGVQVQEVAQVQQRGRC